MGRGHSVKDEHLVEPPPSSSSSSSSETLCE